MENDEVLLKYQDILQKNAKKYSRKSRESTIYWFNEGYFILLNVLHKNPLITSEEIIKTLNIELRNSYRKEKKEQNILYGIDPENINS